MAVARSKRGPSRGSRIVVVLCGPHGGDDLSVRVGVPYRGVGSARGDRRHSHHEKDAVNKAEFIELLAAHFDGNKTEAARALNAVTQTITYQTAGGERVTITGFGVFEKVHRSARMVRNPRTGERQRAKATAVPRFRAGTDLKAYVSGAKKVPKAAKKAAAKTAAPAGKSAAMKAAPTTSAATKSATTVKKAVTKAAPTQTAAVRATTAEKAPAKTASAGTLAADAAAVKIPSQEHHAGEEGGSGREDHGGQEGSYQEATVRR